MRSSTFCGLAWFLRKTGYSMGTIWLVLFCVRVLLGDSTLAEAVQETLDYFWMLTLLGVIAAAGGDGSVLDELFPPGANGEATRAG